MLFRSIPFTNHTVHYLEICNDTTERIEDEMDYPGQIIADGPSTDKGELALGKNVVVDRKSVV